jgi:hypothetical protein
MTDRPDDKPLYAIVSDPRATEMLDFFKVEPLHPTLAPFIFERPGVGPVIHHKLVISVMHHKSLNGFVNRQYLAKRDALDEAARTKNWHRYVFLHERPYRFDALRDVVGLTDAEHWELVGSVWQDCENVHESFAGWVETWSSDRPGREHAMSEEDRAALAKLPQRLTVYRGSAHVRPRRGLSWTLDRDRAEWFARRFATRGGRPRVISGVVHRSRVLAYFTARDESEIVALPADVGP